MSKPTPAHRFLALLGIIPKAANAKVYEGDAAKRLSSVQGFAVKVEFIRSGKAMHAEFYAAGRWVWTALNLDCTLDAIEAEIPHALESLARITRVQEAA